MKIYDAGSHEWEEDLRQLRVRLFAALLFMLVVTAVGTTGFHLIDPSAGWVRAFFMTAITLTTVGYGHEVALNSDGAFIFTAVLILMGMGGVLYFVSTATAFIVEGHLGNVFRKRRMEKEMADLRGHLIICGSGQTAFYTAQELCSVKRPVVLIVETEEAARHAGEMLDEAPILIGDPSRGELLRTAGIERAHGLVACTDNDKENLVVSLTARQLNANIRIVARVTDVEGADKLRMVGADAVVSPNFIGGLRMASELIRPTVVDFLDTMLRDRDLNLRIDEIRIPEDSPAVGHALNRLGLEKVPHALLLAVRDRNGDWQYNPSRNRVVEPEMTLIFLGSPDDARALRDHLQGEMIAVPQ
ncbi:MAG: potassium channel family protein [Gemmatimonadota bacterium]